MDFDPKLFKQLVETFQAELEEMLLVITNGLLALEQKNNPDKNHIIENMFRAAHTIKGGARSLGINDVGEIAHRIESLFSLVQKNKLTVTAPLTDLILIAVDKIRIAMTVFITKSELPFNLNEFILTLENFQQEPQSESPHQAAKKSALKKETPKKEISSKPLKQDSPVLTSAKKELAHSDMIRISISQIDRMTALMEDLIVSKVAIHENYIQFVKLQALLNDLYQEGQTSANQKDILIDLKNTSYQIFTGLKNNLNQQTFSIEALQDEINQLRLVPVSKLFNNLPRYVRDVARSLDKEIDFSIDDANVHMDKLILESLSDPILHILRNAIDHGIESPEDRIKAGKPKVGKVTITISELQNQILINIEDDGRGIDLDKIKTLALKKNLYTQNELQTMNPEQVMEIIFNSGFSTSEIVTDLSGRGVGLDIAKTNLSQINGSISIKTEKGLGTTFSITVPRTLISERGLMVNASNQSFIIPTAVIEKIHVAERKEIIEVNQTQVIMHNNQPIPLFLLSSLLNLSKMANQNDKQLSIVIIKKEERKIALLVDEVIGEREVIIKPLQKLLANNLTVLGGALYGNNQVMFVLNPNDLINKALNLNTSKRIEFESKTVKKTSAPHILVVDDSITTRTLEKNILESKNYKVTVAVNGKEAWDLLQTEPFSLVITDINMPVMDGFTLTQNVKKNDKTQNLPVIIVTSMDSAEEKKKGIDAGADAYIVKSEFESGALLEIISQLV